jgi:hypothetical protein
MDPVTFSVITLAVCAGSIWYAVAHHNQRMRKRNAMMKKVASSVGGEAREGRSKGLRAIHAGVVTKLDGVRASVQQWDIKNAVVCEWRAEVTHDAMPRFRVFKEGIGASLGKAFGLQDVDIGANERFNQHYIVRSEQPGMMRAIWSRRSMDAMLKRFPKGSVESDQREIVLKVIEDITRPEVFEVGLRLVARLANADIFGHAALRELRDAVDVARIKGLPAVCIKGPSDIVAGPVSAGDTIVMRIRAPHADGDDAVVRVRKGVVTGEARLTGEQRRLVESLGTANIEWASREVSVTWQGIETKVARLEAAVELVRSLVAAPKQGVFR